MDTNYLRKIAASEVFSQLNSLMFTALAFRKLNPKRFKRLKFGKYF